MKRPVLNLDHEFDLMVNYQITIESRSVIIESDDESDRYQLYEALEPFPTYEEFLNCNEFEEGELLLVSGNLEVIKNNQEKRRTFHKELLQA